MEKEYIEKKIKDELINKDFELWNKESINFLVSIFEFVKYTEYYSVNLILLNDYISWYKAKESDSPHMYSLKSLMNIYCLINEDMYYNIRRNYISILNKKNGCPFNLPNITDCLLNSNLLFIIFGFFFTIFYIIFRYLFYIIGHRKKEINHHIFELKLVSPDKNHVNNFSLQDILKGENNNVSETSPVNNFSLQNILNGFKMNTDDNSSLKDILNGIKMNAGDILNSDNNPLLKMFLPENGDEVEKKSLNNCLIENIFKFLQK